MAAYGVREADIARVIGIDAKTLRKHYRDELDTGAVKATARVAEFLYRKATTEGAQCVTAAIFWLKTRGGWKETQVQEITGPPISWSRCRPNSGSGYRELLSSNVIQNGRWGFGGWI